MGRDSAHGIELDSSFPHHVPHMRTCLSLSLFLILLFCCKCHTFFHIFCLTCLLQDWRHHSNRGSTTTQRTHRSCCAGGYEQERGDPWAAVGRGHNNNAWPGPELRHRPGFQPPVREAAQEAVHSHPSHGGACADRQNAATNWVSIPCSAHLWGPLAPGLGQGHRWLPPSGSSARWSPRRHPG